LGSFLGRAKRSSLKIADATLAPACEPREIVHLWLSEAVVSSGNSLLEHSWNPKESLVSAAA
jgi:hypothetical protein